MKKNKQTGFSLIELMIVIAIIAMLGVVLFLNFFRFRDNQNLRSAALEVEGDFVDARTSALSRNREYRITFTVGTGNYVIEECTAVGTSPCPGFNTLITKTLPAATAATTFGSANFSGANFVRFQMRGTADPGTVVIQNTNGSQATITTNFRARTYVTFNY